MKRYMLIIPDEDGNPIKFLDERGLNELLTSPIEAYGVKKFLSGPDLLQIGNDPNYWGEGNALLIQFEIVVPQPVTSAYRLE